ncbi:Methionyl-tRNA formyltransferase [Buchnera aphidicola (Cinara cuneomaculata)]|uniref:methionyl-tRNA formyltransferase n=1 Tax=Buchnera aphidicola (Cinara cuneomaculata) TaxID=1660040 RepID=A0A451CYT7_9GAMM|nr:methionyl-tRNA formyltransferase [Buchnera aphidicola]VFP78296.1 Methionyl-tRNA formyltransferase [Buchnera aphidicola (Cinara cuneomaculata)]
MLKKKLKIIFAGSNEFSFAHLYSLFYSIHKIQAIIIKPDNIFYKKKENQYSNIKKFAIQHSIPILQTNNLNKKKFYLSIYKIRADLLIVSSYGSIIPDKILQLFPLGGINIHASLLPRWKGAAPVQWAILSGDDYTGMSVIKMTSKIDSGEIIYQLSCPIHITDNTITLCAKLIPISLQCMYQSLNILLTPHIKNRYSTKNIVETIAPKIKKTDAKICWSLPVIQIDRLIRAFILWPCCYFLINNICIKIKKASILSFKKKNFKNGEIINVSVTGIEVNTQKGVLNIEKIQIPGKKTLHIKQILNSNKKFFIKNTILK